MQTTSEKLAKALRRKFHTLCTKMGISEESKRDMIYSCGVESSKDLTVHDLSRLCDQLEKTQNPKLQEMDAARKRLMAAISGWLKVLGKTQDQAKIKAIACRASCKKSFNDIPLEQLRNLYSAFTKKAKDFKTVDEMTTEELEILTLLN